MRYIKAITVSILVIVTILLILNYRSKHPGKKKIIALVNSNGAYDRIKGFIAVGYSNDTSLYKLFFANMKDRNIAHCLKYKGKSVLWGKIEALKKITNTDPQLEYDPMNPNPKILEHYKVIIDTKFFHQ